MLRRQRQIRAQIAKFLDAGLFALSLWLAHGLRQSSGITVFGGTPQIEPFSDYLWLFLILIPSIPFILEIQGFYDRPLLASRAQSVWILMKSCTLAVLVLSFSVMLFREQLARSVIILFGPISLLMVLLKEEIMRHAVLSRYGQAQLRRRVILAGAREDTSKLVQEMGSNGDGIEIVAQVNINETSTEQFIELLHHHSANAVLFNAKHSVFGEVEKAIQACEVEGVEAWLVADFFSTKVSQTTLDDFNGRPLLVFRTTPEESWQKVIKHGIDLGGAIILLTMGAPLFLLIAAIIRLTSPGPILFRQQRSGLNGKPFTMLKFRSMVTNAEQRKDELAQFNEMSGPVFKVSNDPRITPIGRFLRKYSLDELPQLINVLRGEMSLVGPRPLPVDEVKRFDDLAHRRRLSVKPGLTCLWQIKGRNNVTDFKDWVRLDLEYIDNWSLWLDIKILAQTVPVVITGNGAK